MPKVRYLRIKFDQLLSQREIPLFRAAVIEKTERVASLFHNHKPSVGVIYRYPLIQYKVTSRKATIVCLEAGTDDIHHLLQHRDLDLRIGNTYRKFHVEDIRLNYHQVQLWDQTFSYSIYSWLPLNQKHHEEWLDLAGQEEAKKKKLEAILKGNILSFAKGIDWYIEQELKVEIKTIREYRAIRFKKNEMLGVSLDFETNVSLPDGMGLGKGVSIGFGVVWRQFDNRKNAIYE